MEEEGTELKAWTWAVIGRSGVSHATSNSCSYDNKLHTSLTSHINTLYHSCPSKNGQQQQQRQWQPPQQQKAWQGCKAPRAEADMILFRKTPSKQHTLKHSQRCVERVALSKEEIEEQHIDPYYQQAVFQAMTKEETARVQEDSRLKHETQRHEREEMRKLGLEIGSSYEMRNHLHRQHSVKQEHGDEVLQNLTRPPSLIALTRYNNPFQTLLPSSKLRLEAQVYQYVPDHIIRICQELTTVLDSLGYLKVQSPSHNYVSCL